MNYYIEGLQGSGKSTLVKRMSDKHPEYKVFREGDYSPTELAWCAYVSKDTYLSILKKYSDIQNEIIIKSYEEDEHIIMMRFLLFCCFIYVLLNYNTSDRQMQYPVVVPTRLQPRITKTRPAGRMSQASVHAMGQALFAAVTCINSCGKLSDPRVSAAACQATASNGGQCKWRGYIKQPCLS